MAYASVRSNAVVLFLLIHCLLLFPLLVEVLCLIFVLSLGNTDEDGVPVPATAR